MFTPADVNLNRVQQQLDTLAAMGRQPSGGVTRLTFSAEHMQATHQTAKWMTAAGLDVVFDAWGNLLGRTLGGEGLVLSGSHLDSVPNGGNYDGALGVLAALEAVTLIQERGIPVRKAMGVVSFIEEEGARFHGLMGSKLMTGKLLSAEIDALADADGLRFVDVLRGCEFAYPQVADPFPADLTAFLELHIEQGKRLERAAIPIGMVTSIAGPTFLQVKLTGQADHAGATEYEDRHDSLLAAAEVIVELRTLGRRDFAGRGHVTVGKIAVQPNVTNVIAGETRFDIDYRSADADTMRAMYAAIENLLQTVCERHGVQVELRVNHQTPAVVTKPHIREAFGGGAVDAGLISQELVSWAAHDAMNLAALTDVGMVFVPCRDGRSHTPEEYVKPDDIAAGIAVLANAMLRLAQ
jgi:allantoate deiminase